MKTFLAILFTLSHFIGIAQSTDTLSIIEFYAKAEALQKSNQDKALTTIQMGIDKALKIGDTIGLGVGYYEKGKLLVNLGNFEDATTNYYAALKVHKRLKDTCKIVSIYNNLVFLNIQKGAIGSAFQFIDTAFNLTKIGCTSKRVRGDNFIHQGMILTNLERFEEAQTAFLKAKKLLIDIDTMRYTAANENLAALYFQQEKFEAALEIFLNNYAIYNANKDYASLAQVSNSIGATYFGLYDTKASATYFNRSIQFSKKIENPLLLLDALINLGFLAIDQEDYTKADSINQLVELVIEEAGGLEENLELVKYSIDLFEMFELYEEQAHFLQKEIQIRDSLHLIKNNTLLAKELAKLDIAQKEAAIQTQRFYIACLALGVLALTFFLFFLRNKAKQEKIAHQQQIKERARKAAEETRKKVLEASFQAKQETHKKLHDQVSNPLSVAANYIESFIDEPDDIADLETANQIVNLAYDTSRKIAHELLPFKIDWVDRINLSLGGLERAKNIDSVIQFNRKNINHKTFSPEKGAKVAAIIGNLLVNVEKHAEAQQVVVDIHNADEQVVIQVEDDGIGFDTTQPTGIGLLSIKSNIDALKGTFLLNSIIGEGTKATVFIPVK